MTALHADPACRVPASGGQLISDSMHLCDRANDHTVTIMIDPFRALPPRSEAVVFHTRLGLCTAELAEATHPLASEEITTNLIRLAVQAGDAHAAADLLAHRARRPHPLADEQALTSVIETSGLRQRVMPPDLLNSLTSAAEHALAALADLLTCSRT